MKKNLFLRLCLMMVTVLSLNSCRQDLLPEQETYNNSSKFQLTSKRISLDEAKHKDKLLPEIEKVEAEFKAISKSNVNGKVINYGNGVSIDTDDVIYFEKGPDFHSYTFHIKRENAPLDAPVENLLLSPLEDGSYQELLITYHLTEQEKQKLTQGGFVDTTGKITVTDLQKGTFNSGGQLAKTTDCTWTIKSYYTTCSQGVHSHGEPAGSGEPGTDTCAAPTLSQLVVMVDRTCTAQPADTSLGENGEGGGGGPQNGPGGLGGNPPEETVTAPNVPLPDRKTPCQKIKEQRNDDQFKKRIDTLQGKTGLEKETGYIQKWGGSYEYKNNAGATSTANTLSLPEVASNTYIKGFAHTHVDDKPNSEKKGVKMLSPADVIYFMDLVKNAETKGHSLSDVYAAMVTSTGNYQIRFTGNKFQIKTFTEQDNEYHNEFFGEAMKKALGNQKALELGFLKYIQKEMLLYGITLYRMDDNGTTTEIKLNADKTDTVENNCP